MRKTTVLRAALCVAATMVFFMLTVGASKSYAQGGTPCDPCPEWWVDVNYVFPPCTINVPIDVDYGPGGITHIDLTTDGHQIFPCPLLPALSVSVLGVNVPINAGPIWIPYPCTDPEMPGMCLRAEVRCNPCLEVKLHLEPCQ